MYLYIGETVITKAYVASFSLDTTSITKSWFLLKETWTCCG